MLVTELETKMSAVKNVTHTDVKKLKEIHLLSKSYKAELSALATRRFVRLRETSTERVIGLMTVWAQRTYPCFVSIMLLVRFTCRN